MKRRPSGREKGVASNHKSKVRVGIVMGSESDRAVMSEAACSSHRPRKGASNRTRTIASADP